MSQFQEIDFYMPCLTRVALQRGGKLVGALSPVGLDFYF